MKTEIEETVNWKLATTKERALAIYRADQAKHQAVTNCS